MSASTPNPTPLRSGPARALKGEIRVPGDKSISHRALMLGALCVGETRITGLLEGEDVLATAAAVRAMGAEAEKLPDDEPDGAGKSTGGRWRVVGCGVGGLAEPENVIDMGNAGTGVRLMMGVVAGHDMTVTFTGDASLCRRPMGRVTGPLKRMGAKFTGRDGDLLPMTVRGAAEPLPIEYELPVASAQVKSAVLLAGLNAPGVTTVVEPQPTRDHTENMLRHFGAEVLVRETEDGGRRVSLVGRPELVARDVVVPADISSAAFPIVAALIVPGSQVRVPGVSRNRTRDGLYVTLLEMGADIAFENEREEGGEPVADLVVRHGPLTGVTVPADRAASMIDEFPILSVIAAFAEGRTVMNGVAELRVKESDRIDAMARGLAANGVEVEETRDTMVVHGMATVPGGASVVTHLDHRIAMSFLILGLAAQAPVSIDDASPIATSFPDFLPLIQGLGGDLG